MDIISRCVIFMFFYFNTIKKKKKLMQNPIRNTIRVGLCAERVFLTIYRFLHTIGIVDSTHKHVSPSLAIVTFLFVHQLTIVLVIFAQNLLMCE